MASPLLVFPREHKSPHRTLPIEPHKDLMMKVMIEVGVQPDRKIMVKKPDFTMEDFYRLPTSSVPI